MFNVEIIDDRTKATRAEYVVSCQDYLLGKGYKHIQKDEHGIELWRKDLIFGLIVPALEEANPVIYENGGEQSILEYWALWVGFIEKKMD